MKDAKTEEPDPCFIEAFDHGGSHRGRRRHSHTALYVSLVALHINTQVGVRMILPSAARRVRPDDAHRHRYDQPQPGDEVSNPHRPPCPTTSSTGYNMHADKNQHDPRPVPLEAPPSKQPGRRGRRGHDGAGPPKHVALESYGAGGNGLHPRDDDAQG